MWELFYFYADPHWLDEFRSNEDCCDAQHEQVTGTDVAEKPRPERV